VASGPPKPVTQLLAAASAGDAAVQDQLWSAVYDELRCLAHGQLAREPAGSGFDTTILVHEAYLRLVGDGQPSWNSRGHFFTAAAQAMRRIRVDYARKRRSLKRGGDRRTAPLDDAAAVTPGCGADSADLLALDEALKRLEQDAPRAAQVVMLRYFAGLGVEEAARVLEVSPRTVELDWQFARTWLHRELTCE
jgi:RNA polymerase sigma factor (TIGR02999 family)